MESELSERQESQAPISGEQRRGEKRSMRKNEQRSRTRNKCVENILHSLSTPSCRRLTTVDSIN
jgi:hypothetical protein